MNPRGLAGPDDSFHSPSALGGRFTPRTPRRLSPRLCSHGLWTLLPGCNDPMPCPARALVGQLCAHLHRSLWMGWDEPEDPSLVSRQWSGDWDLLPKAPRLVTTDGPGLGGSLGCAVARALKGTLLPPRCSSGMTCLLVALLGTVSKCAQVPLRVSSHQPAARQGAGPHHRGLRSQKQVV